MSKGRRAIEKKGMPKALKIILIILAVLIIIIGAIAGAGFAILKSKLDKMEYDNLTEEDIVINEEVDANLSEYRNIALLGLDARDDSFSGTRSDCIIIVSINEKTKDVKLLSVYRDTYLDLGEDYGLDKITHAYAYEGPQLTLSALNRNLDLNITEYVAVNFETVRTVVDSIGGITMSITSEEAATGQIPRITSSGTYNLDGDQALAYSRIRYATGGDYKRTERMRDVLTAIFEKAKSLSIGELNSLSDEILPHIRTNISSTEIISLIPSVFSYNIKDSVGWPEDVRGITLDLWYGVPVTLESNVRILHEELFGEEDYEPSDTVKEISDEIINVTGYSE